MTIKNSRAKGTGEKVDRGHALVAACTVTCAGSQAWVLGPDGRITRRTEKGEPGVSRQLPHLVSNGQGVNRPQAREPGLGDPEWHPVTMPEIRRWFGYLSARLRHVRILNGNWTRAVTGGGERS